MEIKLRVSKWCRDALAQLVAMNLSRSTLMQLTLKRGLNCSSRTEKRRLRIYKTIKRTFVCKTDEQNVIKFFAFALFLSFFPSHFILCYCTNMYIFFWGNTNSKKHHWPIKMCAFNIHRIFFQCRMYNVHWTFLNNTILIKTQEKKESQKVTFTWHMRALAKRRRIE